MVERALQFTVVGDASVIGGWIVVAGTGMDIHLTKPKKSRQMRKTMEYAWRIGGRRRAHCRADAFITNLK
ncbi:hypothetical protein [Burkholderia ubonensis]|uniref:hypothetical protein n=1 Tax=Burkholderia ubonensis TaxID=101571 RepID=UPI000A88D49C|nr:hypothetical protein [Burkholderia ubonensis]